MNSKENRHAPKRAALYIRVSTEEQAKEGYSIPEQRRTLLAEAERRKYEVVEVVVDELSGAVFDRPGLKRVMELAESGAIDVVLAIKRDRYFRKQYYRLGLDEDLKEHGVKLLALDDTGHRVGDSVIDSFAEWERDLIIQRTMSGKAGRARSGKIVPNGMVPLGFTYDKEAGTYKIEPEEARTVKRIFELMGKEGRGIHRTKRILERERRKTAAGDTFWSSTSLKRMVQNDIYRPHTPAEVRNLVEPQVATQLDPDALYGIATYTTRDNGIIYIPVIDLGVPREWVEAARKTVKEKRRPDSRADSRFWPLQGHLFCECGRQLMPRAIRKNKGGKHYHYYVCTRYARDGKEACPYGRWHRAEPLEYKVFWAVWELTSDPDQIAARVRSYIEEEKAALKESGVHIRAARTQIAEIDLRREKYKEMASRAYITLDELGEQLKALGEERREAQETLERYADAEAKIERLDNLSQGGLDLAAIAHVRANKTDDELMRDFYRNLGLRVVISPDGEVEISGSHEIPLITTNRTEPT